MLVQCSYCPAVTCCDCIGVDTFLRSSGLSSLDDVVFVCPLTHMTFDCTRETPYSVSFSHDRVAHLYALSKFTRRASTLRLISVCVLSQLKHCE